MPHLGGLLTLLNIDPVTNLAARVRGPDEAQPVAAWCVAFLRENLDDITAHDLVPERDHLAVHLSSNAQVAYFCMHRVGKVHWSGAPRQLQNAAFGSEGIDFPSGQINF